MIAQTISSLAVLAVERSMTPKPLPPKEIEPPGNQTALYLDRDFKRSRRFDAGAAARRATRRRSGVAARRPADRQSCAPEIVSACWKAPTRRPCTQPYPPFATGEQDQPPGKLV